MKNLNWLCTVLVVSSFFISCSGNKESFRAMTFNIRYDNPNDGINAWGKRKGHVRDLIINSNPDFLGIQEGMDHQVRYLEEQLTDYNVIGLSREGAGIPGESCSLLYKINNYTLITYDTFWLSDTPYSPSRGWDAAFKRICTYGKFECKKQNKIIWVFNTHFDHQGKEARIESARLIHNKIKTLTNQNDAVILMGDFNAMPESAPIKYLKEQYSDTELMTENAPLGPKGTFNGFDPEMVVNRKIDYIFSKNLVSVDYHHTDVQLIDSTFISDHLPVSTTFVFK